MMEWVLVLRKLYARAPIVMSQGIPVYKGFNFGQTQAQDTRPSIFSMGTLEGQPSWPPPPELMKTYQSGLKKWVAFLL